MMIASRHGRHAVVLAAVLVFAGPAQAQKTPETVVVTGQRDIDTVVSQFVEQHAKPNRKTGQYMRDDVWPVCPITLGLPKAFNDFVTARVLSVATSVGAKTGAPGTCKPNVEILFTDDPASVVRSLSERTHGAILGMHTVHERPGMMAVTHPIQSWYVTATRMDENSISPVTSYGTDYSVKPGDDKKPAIDDAYRNAPDRISLGSAIPSRRISAIANVLIVADIKEVGGREIGPVADYITMLALSEPASLDACNALPSILDLMATDCGTRPKPVALTENDMAYLKGLYAADLGQTTNSMQKQSIENGMKGEMGK